MVRIFNLADRGLSQKTCMLYIPCPYPYHDIHIYSTGIIRLPVRCQETNLVIHLPRYLLSTSAAHISLMVLRPVLLHRRM